MPDPVLFCAVAAVAGGIGVVYPLPVLLCAAGAALLLARTMSLRAWLCVLLCFGSSAARAAFQLREFERERIEVRDAIAAPSRCALDAVVSASPVWTSGALSFVAEVTRADCGGRALPAPFRARLHGGPDALARQDQLHLIADLAPLQLFRNLDTADPTPNAARQGIVLTGGVLALELRERHSGLGSWIDRLRAHARRRIEHSFAPAAAGMARALVLGENDLAAEDAQVFQKSGLSHLLAVSGTHLVFAVVALVQALTFVLVRVEVLAARFVVSRWASLLGVGLSLVYADFSGGSSSAWRAALMLSLAFFARTMGREPHSVRTFALSALLFAARDPLCAFDLSFMLSVAATAGLIWLGRPLAARCERISSRPARFLALSFGTTLAASVPCAPLLSLLASGVSLAGLGANVLAAPLGETIALPLCLVHVLATPLPWLERGLALVASGALLLVAQIARLSAAASGFGLILPEPNCFQLALLVWFGFGLCLLRDGFLSGLEAGSRARLVCLWCLASLLAFGGLEWATRRAGQPRGVLRTSALDVGQGDSNLIDFPDGRCLLIDGGGFVGSPVDPGKAVVLPVLRARRRQRLDLVVLSHPHPDHFTGLESALKDLDIGEFWDTGQGEAEGAGPVYAELMASLRARGVPIRHPAELCGAVRVFGGASLRVLAPCPAFTPARGANDNSFVISISYGSRRFLFTGDAEAEEEAELLRAHASDLRADYLKTGHHGSRTSSGEEFLSLVAPTLATLSCGVRNRFGHPHPQTLERLIAHGVRALRLDHSGSVEVTSDGRALVARTTRVPR